MDHQTIEERHVPQRYLMGKLSDDELAEFEEHYLHCPECVERLQLAESLHRGLKSLAAEEAAGAAVARAGIFAWWLRLGAAQRAWLATAALLAVALLPSGWLYRETGRLHRDLEQARSRAAALEARPGESSEQAERSRTELEELRARLAAEREELESRLADETRARERVEGELRSARRPRVNPLLVPLSPSRSDGTAGAPENRITLSPSPEPVVLSLELGLVEHERYRVTLEPAAGSESRWQGSDLVPDYRDSLVISFPPGFLAPGDYRLRVEGLSADSAVFVARYDLRIVRR